MITYETIEREEAILEAEAEQIAAHGSHEARVFEALRKAMDGLTVQELEAAIGDKNVTKLGQGKAFREKWISKSKDGKLVATVGTPHRTIRILVSSMYTQLTFFFSFLGRIDRRCYPHPAPTSAAVKNRRRQGPR